MSIAYFSLRPLFRNLSLIYIIFQSHEKLKQKEQKRRLIVVFYVYVFGLSSLFVLTL
jgi:hypothetical protein